MCKYGKNGICRCWKDKEMEWIIVECDKFLYLVLSHQVHFICLVNLGRRNVPSSVEAEVRYTCCL